MEWKDRAEYDLVQSVRQAMTAKDYNKALVSLDQWTKNYPNTDFGLDRQKFYFVAYQELAQYDKAMQAANETLKIDPNDFRMLFGMCTLLSKIKNPSPETLSSIERAAQTLATAGLDAMRPPEVPEADWNNADPSIKVEAHQDLGLIAQLRKDNKTAERHFKSALQINPNATQVHVYLGSAILAQQNPAAQSEALFHFARAASYDGAGALSPEGRKYYLQYLTKAYLSYHGSQEGLQQLLATAKTNAAPPPDFKILTKDEVEDEKQKEILLSNPELALWMKIKEGLTGPDSDTFWESMKGTLVAGLSGSLISQTPTRNPKELALGISDPKTHEARLQIIDEAGKPHDPARSSRARHQAHLRRHRQVLHQRTV